MSRKAAYISGVSAVLCYAALCFSVYDMMLRYSAEKQINAALIPLALSFMAVFAADILISGKTLSLPLYAGLNALFAAGICLLFWKTSILEPFGIFQMIIGCVICTILVAACAALALEPPAVSSAVIRVDILAVFLLTAVFLEPLGKIPGSGESLTALAVVLFVQFFALASGNRSSRAASEVQGSKAGGLLLYAVLVLISGIAALIAVAFSGSAHSVSQMLMLAAKTLLKWLKALILLLYRVLDTFMRWLTSLFPASDSGALIQEPVQQIDMGEITEYEQIPVPGWFYIVLGGIAVLALFFIFWKLRHIKIGRTQAVFTPAESTRSSGLNDAFRKLRTGLYARLKLAILRIRHRKSAPALLLRCEKLARGDAARRQNESGEAFLRRLAGTQDGIDSQQASSLLQLADIVEQEFYNKKDSRLQAVPIDLYKSIRSLRFDS